MSSKVFTFCLMFILTITQVNCQQTDASYLRAMESSMRKQHLYYDVSYQIYDKARPKQMLEETKIGCYLWYPYSIYKYSNAEVEAYHNDRAKILIDKSNKTILINKSDKQFDKLIATAPLSIDSMLEDCEKVEVIKNTNTEISYRLTFNQSNEEIDFAVISINKTYNRIAEMTIYFKYSMEEMYGEEVDKDLNKKVKPVVKILFSGYKELTKNDWKLFKAEHILKISTQGKVTLMPAYSSYSVTNYYNAR